MNLTKQQFSRQKCFAHPKKPLNILYNGHKISRYLICLQCAVENKIQVEEMIDIQDILDLDFESESLSKHFPIHIKDHVTQKLKQISCQNQSKIKEMKDYYSKLMDKVSESIKNSIEKQEAKIEEVFEQINLCDVQYQRKQFIKHLQSILVSSQEYQSQNQNIHTCIMEFCQKKKDIEENLSNLVDQQSQFSCELAEQIEEDVLKLIESISFQEKLKIQSIDEPVAMQTLFNYQEESLSLPQLLPIAFEMQTSPLKIIQNKKMENPAFKKKNETINFVYEKFKTIEWNLSNQQFLPSKQNRKSATMKIQSDNNNQVVITNTSNGAQQCYLKFPLKKSSNFIINLSINNISNSSASFYFGLLNESYKEVSDLDQWDNIYYDQIDGGKTTKIIKGKGMHTGKLKKIGKKQFEIRFNIEKRFFQICSKDYQNILELNNKFNIDPSKQYLFAILLANQSDQVIIHKIREVEKFDEFT